MFSVKEDFKLIFNPQWLQGVVISKNALIEDQILLEK